MGRLSFHAKAHPTPMCQTTEMRDASNDANGLLEILKDRKNEIGLKDFMRQARFITKRLQSITVDMNRVLETNISEDVWRRYNKGETVVFVRKMLGFRERVRLTAIRKNTDWTENSGNTLPGIYWSSKSC